MDTHVQHAQVERQVTVACLLATILAIAIVPAWGGELPIPELGLWEANMLNFGPTHCTALTALDISLLDSVYYDAERVYYQIADYTDNPLWITCAHLAQNVYRD